MRNYLPDQLNCIKKLKRFKVGALFMQAGTGKTQTAVGIINSREDIDKVLWFTPCQTKQNLKEELEKKYSEYGGFFADYSGVSAFVRKSCDDFCLESIVSYDFA